MQIMLASMWAVAGGTGAMVGSAWVCYNCSCLAALLFFGVSMWLYATGFKLINQMN